MGFSYILSRVAILVIFALNMCHCEYEYEYYLDQIAMPSNSNDKSTSGVNEDEECELFPTTINPRCTCGTYTKSPGKNQNPWMAALFYKKFDSSNSTFHPIMYCMATLINDRYALTTARCVQGLTSSDLEIWLSSSNLWSSNNGATKKKLRTPIPHKSDVVSILKHANFDPNRSEGHDIAIIKLKVPVPLTKDGIVPVCLPWNIDYSKRLSGKYSGLGGIVSEWKKKGRSSYVHKETKVPIISNDDCSQQVQRINGSATVIIHENNLCADDVEHNAKSSCDIDTGAPIVITKGGSVGKAQKILVGMTEWIFGCTQDIQSFHKMLFPNSTAHEQIPGVYTRVNVYEDFIFAHASDAVWCSS